MPVPQSLSGRDSYALNDGQIREVFFQYFWERYFPITLLNSAQFLQLVLDNSQTKAYLPYEFNVPTTFKAMFTFIL